MSTKRDYYEVLGLAKNASGEEIKKAYRKLSMKFHPDRLAGQSQEDQDKGEASFKEVKEAYEQLSNSETRASYDRFGHTATHTGNGFRHSTYSGTNEDLEEVLRSMFSRDSPFGDIFGQQRSQPRRQISISLEQAYIGVAFKDSDINIQLPSGVRHGTKFVHNNIIYQVNVMRHSRFQRSNDDLLVDTEINAIEAMLGVDVILEHLDKQQLQFTIPAGIQNGQIVRLGGKGMKNPETDKMGDLLVRITITIPETLSDEQRAILRASMGYRKSFNI
jgi:DnaJ-class molecular chaperone